MIRVLHFELTENRGGIESFIINLYKNIDLNEINFDFVTTSTKEIPCENFLKSKGAKVYHIQSPKKLSLYINDITKIISKNDYDIIHIHKNSAINLIPFIIAKKLGNSNIIIHSHNTSPTKNNLKFLHYINRLFLKKIKITKIACSKSASNWMFSKSYINDVTIVPNGIELHKYSRKEDVREKIRLKYGIKDNEFLIGNVGRLSKQKNQKYLIELLLMLDSRFKLMIVGDGELKRDLHKLVREKKLEDRVIFTGSVDDVNNYLQAMDIFVMPSKFEGLPIAGIEAQAVGLPVLVSDGISEELKLTSNIYSLNLDNISNWVKYVKKYSKRFNDQSIKQIRESGYDIKLTSKKMQKIYKELLRRKEK